MGVSVFYFEMKSNSIDINFIRNIGGGTLPPIGTLLMIEIKNRASGASLDCDNVIGGKER